MTDHELEALEAEVVREDDTPGGTAANPIVAAADILPSTLYLLPLSERPFFPAQALPLLLNEEPWLPTVEAAAEREQRVIGLMLVKPDSAEKAESPADFYDVGTVARMHQLARNEAACNSSPRASSAFASKAGCRKPRPITFRSST